MKYLSTAAAKEIARIKNLIAEAFFKKETGKNKISARCIYCGYLNGVSTGAKTLTSGKKIFYHTCLNCTNKYTSQLLTLSD
jgi:hypothetical protein